MKAMSFAVPIAILGGSLLLVCLQSCKRSGDDPVASAEAADPEMDAAVEQAQKRLPEFISKFNAPGDAPKYFLAEGRFYEGETTEQLMMAVLSLDGTSFHGMITDEPKSIRGFKYKQAADLPHKDVTDWMYLENGKLIGAFRYKVRRRRLSVAERTELERDLPYKIE